MFLGRRLIAVRDGEIRQPHGRLGRQRIRRIAADHGRISQRGAGRIAVPLMNGGDIELSGHLFAQIAGRAQHVEHRLPRIGITRFVESDDADRQLIDLRARVEQQSQRL